MHPILIVDDEVEMRIAMSETLKHHGYPVDISHNALDAINKFKKNPYAMVITDMTMPKRSGIELLKDIKTENASVPVLMVTGYATVDTAVEAMKQGAFDFIQKPFKFDNFVFLVERALAAGEATPAHKPKPTAPAASAPAPKEPQSSDSRDIITADAHLRSVLGVAENIAKSKATVLIQSESGTGKELLAHFIHLHSDRAQGPFVAVNCAALPDTLLENELFGHRKGAFTGAVADYKGRFEQASGGTLLLDEISEMALPLQAKLLRVLQEYEVDPVGGRDRVPVDVRVVATTNRDLFQYVEAGKFREDLYFRLNVIPLVLPPLRERKGDIPLLAGHFVKKHAARNNRDAADISTEAMEMLCVYNWRGNVRELENVMERAVLLSQGARIQPVHLLMGGGPLKAAVTQPAVTPHAAAQHSASQATSSPTNSGSAMGGNLGIQVGMSLREVEKKLIFETLKNTNGNRTQAAKLLSISIRTLRNKLNEYAAEGDALDFGPGGDEEDDEA